MSAFIDSHRARFGVEPICRALGVSASAYYHRASGHRSTRAVADERLLGLIEQVAERNYGAYGYLKRQSASKGSAASRRAVQAQRRADGPAVG